MSYNVDSWRVKKLADLRVPVASFFKHERKDWHPEKLRREDGTLTLDGTMDSLIVEGVERDGILHVSRIDIHGEGSGTFLNWIVEPALRDSTGELEVVRIWEGGDSIDRLTVKNGVVKSEPVEL